jgi:hypothetical protein
MREIVTLIILFSVCGFGYAQEKEMACSMQKKVTLDGVEQGADWAIVCAGESGDEAYVPILQDKYDKLMHSNGSGGLVALQVALVRLGVKQQVKEVVCEVLHGTPRVRYKAALHLSDIGGWLAFNQFASFLEDKPENSKSIGSDGDLIYPSMQIIALGHLSKVLGNSPVASPSGLEVNMGKPSVKAVEWKEWIKAHQAELKQLKPNDEVTVTATECRQILQNDPVARMQE